MSTIIPLRPDNQSSIAAQIHRRLREDIVRGALAPGQALSESEISTRYGISRQPVREAFIRLANDNLVSIQPQRGTFVVRISVKDVMDARFVREAVEVAVVREAARNATTAAIAALRELVECQRQVAAGDNDAFLALDEAFHQELAHAAGRRSAWQAVDRIKAQMDRVRYLSYEAATPVDRLIAQHERIVDAIAARNPDEAEAAVRAHLEEILESLPEIARQYPEVFER
ncbi:GntR family transcriptional regulator [Uliginosibacterium sp. H1]|uniref:GntR family transcriptional regulator n=1 Tax=Uliginosibacterium sp. H1 TaxID=3114757 RepID=UPI002E17401B|nr:GntR family transcriptional regulator [Uliginosibacterium sp. H1]